MNHSRSRTVAEPGPAASSTEPDDAAVVARCRKGDNEAWAILIARYRQRVFHLAYQFVGDFAEAEDLVQEIFLKLYGSLDRFDPTQSLKAWLTAVGRNYLIDHYRRHRKHKQLLDSGDDALRSIPDAAPSPVGNAERRERAEILRRGLAALPEPLRRAVILRDVSGMSYQEIARDLKIPVGTVKSRINRGRSELAVVLKSDLRAIVR